MKSALQRLRPLSLTAALLLCISMAGCVVNPVTGQREVGFVSVEQQINIGKTHYGPSLQMQGGEYQVDPELTAYVRQVGERLAKQSPIDLPYEFSVLNNSVPNAWALPGGKIAINRGLLTELRNESELAAVLGHEIVHAAGRHGAQRIERGTILQGALLATAVGARNQEYAGALLSGAQVAAGLLTQKYGRDAERQSDYYGTRYMAKAGYDPYGAVTLQETFVRLSQGGKTDWLQGLFASHPPSEERVRNNKQLVETLREEGFTGGEFGADRFQAALRQVRKDQPAYAAFDAARAAAAEKKYDVAAQEVSKAIRLQPKDAQFHGLRGDIRRVQGRAADAVTNYNRAIERYDGYFAFYIGRGLAYQAQREMGLAKSDLSRSVDILPTAVAYNALGQIAETEGNQDAAVRYYEAASGAQGDAGRTAFANLLRVDLPRQPAKYLKTDVVRDSGGRLVLRVANTTALPLANVKVRVEMTWRTAGVQNHGLNIARLDARQSQMSLVPIRDDELVAARAYTVSAALAR